MRVAPGREHPIDFVHDFHWIANMFQNRITLYAYKGAGRKRQLLRVGGDIHSGQSVEVKIDIAFDNAAGVSDVQIPATEREIPRLSWICYERCGWLEQP